MDPQEAVFEILAGRWRSQTLYAGAKLGVFESATREPRSADSIADELGLDRGLAYRLLRALASLGLLEELPDRQFTVTPSGEMLRADHPQSLRGAALLREGPEHYAVWKHLPAIVRDGEQNGFVREFGKTAFDYAACTPEYAESFDTGMSSYSTVQTPWILEAFRARDFSSATHVCDVGGGQGHLLGNLLVQYPHLSGTVFERPGVLDDPQTLWAHKLGVSARCRYVSGDMFVDVPAADAYFFKMILHNWSDEDCVAILQAVYRRAAPSARVFVIEHIIPPFDTPHFAKFFDIHMMSWGPGRERTVEEYKGIFESAGWRYEQQLVPQRGPISILEFTREP